MWQMGGLRRAHGYGTSGKLVRDGKNVDDLAAAPLTEFHGPGGRGEQGVVAAPPDVLARMEAGASLAHDDGARVHDRAVEHLDAEALGVRIPAVAGGTTTLGLGHVGS